MTHAQTALTSVNAPAQTTTGNTASTYGGDPYKTRYRTVVGGQLPMAPLRAYLHDFDSPGSSGFTRLLLTSNRPEDWPCLDSLDHWVAQQREVRRSLAPIISANSTAYLVYHTDKLNVTFTPGRLDRFAGIAVVVKLVDGMPRDMLSADKPSAIIAIKR